MVSKDHHHGNAYSTIYHAHISMFNYFCLQYPQKIIAHPNGAFSRMQLKVRAAIPAAISGSWLK
ncbi:hypothetical protein NECAME_00759 [Necator americanus]|uniref:Uncharacterized protein n=1 Tax=Necator americanus TaxID=51031 RepID=W2SXQ7_NECAM|nr:hypothetical protein NECAME_00759 [Necator americanus]ETN73671.1 hypothetical protein NECAME_00759 [Necator americanus]